MKRIALLILSPALAYASPVFDGYDSYYATLHGQLFQGKGIDLQPYGVPGHESVRLSWSGAAGGSKHAINIRDGVLAVDGHTFKPKTIRTFPGEVISDGDLDSGSTAYFTHGWACVDNTPRSASGTAVRHKAVYLVKLNKSKPSAWKLPSLFAACAGVRLQSGQIRFDKAEYRYKDGQDEPIGVIFQEYTIQGNSFSPTSAKKIATFTEPDNVYKFEIE